MVGKTLSHYKVIEKIGQGGMGEVYRAEDTSLKRDVAIKVLPEQFTKDPQRLARFEREAQLLASLNHPNIAAIHSFEHSVAAKRVPCLNNKKRKAEHSFSITEEQIWAIREVKIKAKKNSRKRLSVVQRKNDD